MSQGRVLQIGVDLLDDRVMAVRGVRGDRVQLAGGEERVEPPDVEQRGLRWVLVGVEVGDAAHHQRLGTCWPGFFEPNAVKSISASPDGTAHNHGLSE